MDDAFIGRLLLGLNPQDVEEARRAALADRVAAYFAANEKIEYIGVAGIGRHGGALLFQEHDEAKHPTRKIIIKYSLNAQADADLRNEAHWLEMLRGSEHIGKLIDLNDPNLDITGSGKRPTLALEFIPHGPIRIWRERMERTPPPNRLLWRIYLCLIRQVVAMKYPMRGPNDGPLVRETIRQDVAPAGITQNSGHYDNFIIGDIEPSVPGDEHGLVPVIKLIDFGRGVGDPENWLEADQINLASAAYLMLIITLPQISMQEIIEEQQFGASMYQYTPRGSTTPVQFETSAVGYFTQAWCVDDDLKTLVARCGALDGQHIPTVEEALEVCENAVRYKTGENIQAFGKEQDPEAFIRSETDEMINRIVQKTMLDADVIPEVPSGQLPTNTAVDNAIFDFLVRKAPGFGQMGTTLLGLRPPVRVKKGSTRPTPEEKLTAYQKYLISVRERYNIEITEEQMANAGYRGDS
ncbi:hypothetical protein F5Y04DRAFT_285081 [Hypomontagnella monticulosa]|nr:hypothetical protein F5Y04DRAFT_285081 [Hypomontagnella monticulosa]